MEWIFIIAILIFSVVLHEVSHGTMANYLGDPTAKNEGRLTLNPLYHLDLFGSIILPLFLVLTRTGIVFGWAKPVPINPYNFRDQKYGEAKVAIAGPLANLSLALVFGLILRFLPVTFIHPSIIFLFSYIVYINIILSVFNLLPVPPLDGSHILFAFLPRNLEDIKMFLQRFGVFVLLFIIFFFFGWVSSIAGSIFQFIVGVPLL
jgi:Zn-dependent protease